MSCIGAANRHGRDRHRRRVHAARPVRPIQAVMKELSVDFVGLLRGREFFSVADALGRGTVDAAGVRHQAGRARGRQRRVPPSSSRPRSSARSWCSRRSGSAPSAGTVRRARPSRSPAPARCRARVVDDGELEVDEALAAFVAHHGDGAARLDGHAAQVRRTEAAAHRDDAAVVAHPVAHEVVQVGPHEVAHAERAGNPWARPASSSMWMGTNSSLTAA